MFALSRNYPIVFPSLTVNIPRPKVFRRSTHITTYFYPGFLHASVSTFFLLSGIWSIIILLASTIWSAGVFMVTPFSH